MLLPRLRILFSESHPESRVQTRPENVHQPPTILLFPQREDLWLARKSFLGTIVLLYRPLSYTANNESLFWPVEDGPDHTGSQERANPTREDRHQVRREAFLVLERKAKGVALVLAGEVCGHQGRAIGSQHLIV